MLAKGERVRSVDRMLNKLARRHVEYEFKIENKIETEDEKENNTNVRN